MSKITAAIRAELTGRQRAKPKPLEILEVTQEAHYLSPLRQNEYRVGVFLGRSVYVDVDNTSKGFDQVRYVKEMVAREIAHVLYGDLREKLYELRYAIYDGGSRKAMQILDSIFEEII